MSAQRLLDLERDRLENKRAFEASKWRRWLGKQPATWGLVVELIDSGSLALRLTTDREWRTDDVEAIARASCHSVETVQSALRFLVLRGFLHCPGDEPRLEVNIEALKLFIRIDEDARKYFTSRGGFNPNWSLVDRAGREWASSAAELNPDGREAS